MLPAHGIVLHDAFYIHHLSARQLKQLASSFHQVELLSRGAIRQSLSIIPKNFKCKEFVLKCIFRPFK
jgi:hypothetical protein